MALLIVEGLPQRDETGNILGLGAISTKRRTRTTAVISGKFVAQWSWREVQAFPLLLVAQEAASFGRLVL
jgi:hypothetical protein